MHNNPYDYSSGMQILATFEKGIRKLEMDGALMIQFDDGSWACLIHFYKPRTETDIVH